MVQVICKEKNNFILVSCKEGKEMNSMVYIREEKDSTPLTNSLQDKICIQNAGKCL